MDEKKKYTSLEHQIRLVHENAPSGKNKPSKLKEVIEQVIKNAKAKKDKAANPNVDFNPTTIERGENESMVKND